MTALVCVADVAGATGAATPGVSQLAQTADQSPSAVPIDASATIETGTPMIIVTAAGSPAENVSVSYDDQTTQTATDGTTFFAVNVGDEAEIELETDGVEGELAQAVADGSLTLFEAEYEYDHDIDVGDDEAEEEAEEDDDDEDDD